MRDIIFLIIKILFVIGFLMAASALCADNEVCSRVTNRLIILGGFCFIVGPFLTGSGFTAKCHYISTPTPEIIWKLVAILAWITSLIVMLFAWYGSAGA